ncbi:transposase [Hyella patelloides LEGE 07179]|uniref:Transposase n=1 Tax=Hyella patelloides LEGE 07179 TaxID=945734 RepID=A0A563VKV4_9CYAN|nr:DUF6262 family protein [Hyella patelloides]VEP12080.1 transposase [Hyella patelloides LEGE 07179]
MSNRQKQAEVLRRTQALRKEQKKEQVLKAIAEIQKQKKPLTFKNIATVAGCSISYLYKWDEIKAYIHELQNKKQTTLNSLGEDSKNRPHSLKTLHQVAKDKIRKLEAEIKELKHQNEILRGHVAEIYEIRDENERLRTQLKELTRPSPTSKVVSITTPIKEKKATSSTTATNNDIEELLIDSIKVLGIKVSKKLRAEIASRDIEKVKLSIEAFKQYRDNHDVKSQEACLLSMICDEAEPNTESKTQVSVKPQEKIVTAKYKSPKKLVDPDKLKKLSNIFNKKND